MNDLNDFFVEFVVAVGAKGAPPGELANFVVQVKPSWAPLGAARLRELVLAGYYDQARFFRVLPK